MKFNFFIWKKRK